MKTDGFCYLSKQKFQNVKISAFYEQKIKPIELIVNINCYIKPTDLAIKKLTNETYREKMLDKISVSMFNSFFRKNKYEYWQYDGSRYTYGHELESIKLYKKNNKTFFGIDLYFIQKNDDIIDDFYTKIYTKIANSNILESNKYCIITSK